MSKTVGGSVEFPVSVDHVFSAFADENYWMSRMSAYGGNSALDALVVDADGTVRVSVVQDLTHLLPALIAKRYPRDFMVVRTETWQRFDGYRVGGQVTVVVEGAPASGDGTALLVPSGDGSRLDFVAAVNCGVPLLGRRVESRLASQLDDDIQEIQRFTTRWIADQVFRSHEAPG
ncbi:MAG: DUF2505 domain-containing protein [Mycobacterium sp.]